MNFFAIPIATNPNATEEFSQVEHVKWNKGLRGLPSYTTGTKRSPETIAKLKASHLGKVRSAEGRAKQSATMKGRPSKLKGTTRPAEVCAKIAKYWVDKPGRAVMTPQGSYISIDKAATAMNLTRYFLQKLIKQQPNDYYYIKD